MMGMNLHAIAAPIVGAVTGTTTGDWWENTGYTTDAAGKRTPGYDKHLGVDMRVQSMTMPELTLMDGLNIQGIKRGVYMQGAVKAVDRAGGEGGDLLIFPDQYGINAVWLVVAVLEAWDQGSGWTKVAVTKQIDAVTA